MTTKSIFKIIALVVLNISTTVKAQITPTNNIISIDITLPQNASYTYDSAFINCYNIGMRQIGLHFLWKSGLEATPGIYSLSTLDIANLYYPYFNVPVDLNIDPIETNVLELPSDLTSYVFSDTVVINRFKILLDSVFNHIPDLQLSSLVIGSEVDGYLGTDSAKWAQYTTFYSAVSAYAKTLRPGLKVACEAMYPGLTGASSIYLQTLNSYSDYIGVSYYPLNSNFTVKPASVVAIDFSNLVSLYPSKPIYFYQLGYPSSSSCNSSETKQAQFIDQVFQSWDTYSSNIKMIDFTWLHDWSSATVNYWSTYYGISDTAFLGFLGSIGLRNWSGNGTDKQAYKELECETKQRGYNTLNINCTTGISELSNNENNPIALFPNPVKNILHIQMSFDLENAEIKIYNQLGQIKKRISNINNRNISIETVDLSNGLYVIVLQNGDRQLNRKFIINK
jgi:hypothetical protein